MVKIFLILSLISCALAVPMSNLEKIYYTIPLAPAAAPASSSTGTQLSIVPLYQMLSGGGTGGTSGGTTGTGTSPLSGSTGTTGSTGTASLSGSTGSTGSTGTASLSGSTGSTGTSSLSGSTGSTGTASASTGAQLQIVPLYQALSQGAAGFKR